MCLVSNRDFHLLIIFEMISDISTTNDKETEILFTTKNINMTGATVTLSIDGAEVKKTPTKTDEQTNDVPIIPNGIGVIPKLVPRRAEEIQREKRTKFAYNVSRELNILEGEKNTADAETQKREAEQSSDLEI